MAEFDIKPIMEQKFVFDFEIYKNMIEKKNDAAFEKRGQAVVPNLVSNAKFVPTGQPEISTQQKDSNQIFT